MAKRKRTTAVAAECRCPSDWPDHNHEAAVWCEVCEFSAYDIYRGKCVRCGFSLVGAIEEQLVTCDECSVWGGTEDQWPAHAATHITANVA